MQLNISVLNNFFNHVLAEDLGICGDITTDSLISEQKLINYRVVAKQNLILSGTDVVKWFFDHFKIENYILHSKDSDYVKVGDSIFSGKADAKSILLVERIILNFLQHLSGIATLTNKFVCEVSGTNAKIADTRKTTPGLRLLQKYAVRCGGGVNHRLSLDSCVLIKDNHIEACGSITKAYHLALKNKPHYSKIIVECDTIDQFKESLDLGVEVIMLDNMNVDQVKECVSINNGKAFLEVSGGVKLNNVRGYALTGVDLIAVGALTHSAPAVDISLDII